MRREIARLEEEIPRWRTVVDSAAQPGGVRTASIIQYIHAQ